MGNDRNEQPHSWCALNALNAAGPRGEYKMDLNAGNNGASQPQSQSQSQSRPPSQPRSPDETVDVDMASIGEQSSDPGEKANTPPPSTANGQAKKPNAKDPLRPRRKKARRACYACQRAHLTCGRCSVPSPQFSVPVFPPASGGIFAEWGHFVLADDSCR